MRRTPYHLRFSRIDARAVAATRALIRARPHRGDPVQGLAALQTWVDHVSAIYLIAPCPVIVVAPVACCGAGCYIPSANGGLGEIRLPSLSITTLIHEF